MTSQNLQERHIELCAQDIARIARLIVAEQSQGINLHSAFVRRATTARRYNFEALPARALDIDDLFTDALQNNQQNFRAAFAAAQAGPRLTAENRNEIASRALADSSFYLDPLMKWMERNRSAGTFSQYCEPARASRLLRQQQIVALKTEADLGASINRYAPEI